MSLHVDKVELRQPVLDDRELIFQMSIDPIANAMSMVYPRSRIDFEERWERVQSDPSVISRTILFDSEVVGKINSFPVDGQIHVGYLIVRTHWGKGIGTRALRAFLDVVDTRPLRARIASSNIGSMRVLEKCGFVKVGERVSPEDERYMACIEFTYELG